MYIFFPERIYEFIKDKECFKRLTSHVEKIMKATTFEQAFYNQNLLLKSNIVMDSYNEVLDIIKKENKFWYDEVMILYENNYTKEDFVKLYNENIDSYDIETKLILLSQIINNSYEDRTFLKWMNIYVDNMPVDNEDIMRSLSKYCHECYMLNRIFIYCNGLPMDEDYLSTAINKLNEYKAFADNYVDDTDMINHNYMEALRTIIYQGLYKARDNEDVLIKQFEEGYNSYNIKDFQYSTGSYAIVDVLSKWFDLYYDNRMISEAFSVLESIAHYINEAMKDKEIFFRGLQYFDKICQYSMMIMIRKLLRLHEVFPELDLKMSNLSKEDRKFCLKSIESYDYKRFPNKAKVFIFKSHLQSIDDFIDLNETTFKMIRQAGGIKNYKAFKEGV